MTFENEDEGNVTHPDSTSLILRFDKCYITSIGAVKTLFEHASGDEDGIPEIKEKMNELDLTEWANMAAIVTEALEMRMFFPFTQGYNSKERQAGLRATKNIRKKIKTGKKN